MPILKSYQVVEKNKDSITCIDVIHVEKTHNSETLYDLIPKLVYGCDWKYAYGIVLSKNIEGEK